jgi:hypothetical protein
MSRISAPHFSMRTSCCSKCHGLRLVLYGEIESEISPCKIELNRIVSFGEIFKSLDFGFQTCWHFLPHAFYALSHLYKVHISSITIHSCIPNHQRVNEK